MEKSKMKQNYHFVEVGTSDFDTLIERVGDDVLGISIEPHKTYLERLPNRSNVTKLCAALVPEKLYEQNKELNFYFVDEKIIEEKHLGGWLKGCNSVGKPHDFHLTWFHDPNIWHQSLDRSSLPTVNLLEMGLVTVEKVPCLTFPMLVERFNIGHIGFLKVDVEGQDPPLLKDILEYYVKNNPSDLPKQILFETNTHSVPEEVEEIKAYMRTLGYKIEVYINDCLATLEK